jgi:hypothetical protein
MMAQECLSVLRVLGGHDINLSKQTKGPKSHILRVPDGKANDIERARWGLFLTLFSSHRYNFPFQKYGFFS